MNLELDMPDKSPKPDLKKKNQQEFKQFLNVQKQESARNLQAVVSKSPPALDQVTKPPLSIIKLLNDLNLQKTVVEASKTPARDPEDSYEEKKEILTTMPDMMSEGSDFKNFKQGSGTHFIKDGQKTMFLQQNEYANTSFYKVEDHSPVNRVKVETLRQVTNALSPKKVI